MMDITISLNSALAGRYTIERELGRGGMATVYLARDARHDRLVAIKVLDPELGAVLGAERFLAEIRVTANLQHPHLLPLFDSGEAAGLLFYVMPYVTGESLRARLERERQLPVDEALRITVAVLSALDYAHGHGVIHRDLKPENILLQHGEPVVADFGIALAVSNAGGQRVTQTGLSLGTPQYMSPEQATGDRIIDARSDVYSIGAVLYEMLAGEAPHTGATVQAVIARVITERPRSLRLMRDTVPDSVDNAVARALAKLPADRWATALEFANALGVGGSHATLERRGALPALGRRLRRATRSTSFWRGAAAALLVASAGFAWGAFRPREGTGDLQLAGQLTFEGNVTGTAISPDGAWVAYVADDCFGKAFACTSTLQVREVDGTQSVKLATWPMIFGAVRWSPDGTTVSFLGAPDSQPPALYLLPRLGGVPQRVSAALRAWTFAPDGRVAVVEGPSGHQALVWLDARSFARVDSASLPVGLNFADLDFTPDGGRIAARAGGRRLVLLDGRGRLLDSTSAIYAAGSVRWEASHSAILMMAGAPGTSNDLYRVPVSGGTLQVDRASVALGQPGDGAEAVMDASRSGRVVVAAGPATFEVLTLRIGERGASWTLLTHRTSFLRGSAFSPDGANLAGAATDNLGENVYIFPVAGGAPRAVTAQRGFRDYPFYSADGRLLAYDASDSAFDPLGSRFIDNAGGRERTIRTARGREYLSGWLGNDALVIFSGGAVTIVDTTGAVRRRMGIPDSLAQATTPVTDATLGKMAYWSVAAGAVVVVDLTTGRSSAVLHSRTLVRPAGWGRDGTLFVTTTAGADAMTPGALARRDHMLQKLAPGASTLVPVAPLPSGCWTARDGVSIGGGGAIAACTVRRWVPDVWLAQRGGRSR